VAVATRKHEGQKRRYTGEPYVTHCIRVAEKLESLEGLFPVTDDMLKAALLHDTLEDTDMTFKELQSHFGNTVAEYVQCLSLDPKAGNRRQRYAKYTRQLKNAPVEVQRIKACDIWDNLADIRQHDPDFFPVYRREALKIAEAMDKLDKDFQHRLIGLCNGERQSLLP
jgi:(p)ppGpp synthase/HD superfamily hydrolase